MTEKTFDATAAVDAAAAMMSAYQMPHPAHLQAEELIRACERIAELEAENKRLRADYRRASMSNDVNWKYVKHWKERAERAERQLAEARAIVHSHGNRFPQSAEQKVRRLAAILRETETT